MMNFEQIAELEKKVLIHTYDRLPILAVGGEGCAMTGGRSTSTSSVAWR